MSTKSRRSTVPREISAVERGLFEISALLARSELAWAGRILLRGLRIGWKGLPLRAEHATGVAEPIPTGPFRTTRDSQLGDLLLWVPRGIDSYLIDELTGGYGYSHATIDTGEIDVPTGKPVMAEITIGQTVMHKFQDEYGQRPFVRLPLRRTDVNVRELLACIESKMGEKYDMLDVLTLGEIDDPAKEACSSLIADCLPDEDLKRIARARRRGLLDRASVSVRSRLDIARVRAFVSPNGFAEYFGVPKGRKVRKPNVPVEPNPASGLMQRTAALATRHQGWKVVGVMLAVLALVLVVKQKKT